GDGPADRPEPDWADTAAGDARAEPGDTLRQQGDHPVRRQRRRRCQHGAGIVSAVWLAARGAVRRRRTQTAAVGLVVFLSAVTIVVALSMLTASANPFGRAFAAQNGAHLAVAFNPARVTDARLAQTTRLPGVTAAAGPFAEATVNVTSVSSIT